MPVPPLPVAPRFARGPLRRTGRDTRVLLCDDDLDFSREMAAALSMCGFAVRTLADGNAPVELFELFRPDIVFLDLFMPPPDGFEVMAHIGRDTGRGDFSLVLLSGADGPLLEVAAHFCQARGIHIAGILRKPVKLDAILEICRAHLVGADCQGA